MRYRPLGLTGLQISEISIGSWLTYSGGIATDEMFRAFNMGIGLIVVCDPQKCAEVARTASGAIVIGEVVASAGVGYR